MTAAVKLLAFAGARDVIGDHEVRFEFGTAATVGELMDAICERFPALQPHRGSVRLAVNGCYASDDDPVADGDEVALIPPVAGG